MARRLGVFDHVERAYEAALEEAGNPAEAIRGVRYAVEGLARGIEVATPKTAPRRRRSSAAAAEEAPEPQPTLGEEDDGEVPTPIGGASS